MPLPCHCSENGCEGRRYEELFQMSDASLNAQGLKAGGGQIIDATLIPVPKGRNQRKEKKSGRARCPRRGRATLIGCDRRSWMPGG